MGPTAFRDGIFSASDPMAKYGTLQTSYSDGSLGAMPAFLNRLRHRAGLGAATVSSCQNLCGEVNRIYGTPERIKSCNKMCSRYPKRWSARLARRYKAAGAKATNRQVMRKTAAAGLGTLDSTTMTALGLGALVVGGLLWVGTRK